MARGNVRVSITADSRGLDREVRRAEKSLGGMSGTAGRIAKRTALALAGVGTAAGAAGGEMISLASDAEETASKFRIVFGKETPRAIKQLNDFSKATGTSRFALREQAAQLQALVRPMGLSTKEAGKMSVELTKLATDLASFNNTSVSEAIVALQSGLVGEAEPLRRYGVQLSETRVQAHAYATGIARAGAELTTAEKAQARYELILKDSTLAQGDAVRTSSSFANQFKRLKSQVTDTATELGVKMLPAATKAVGAITGFITELQNGEGAGGRFRDAIVRAVDDVKKAFEPLAKEIGGILADDDLSLGEKLSKSFTSAISFAAPKIGQAALDAAPKVAKAFIDGFLNAGPWGRLAIGAWLLPKLGGLGAFRLVGSRGGAEMAAGMGTGVAQSGLKGRLATMLRGWGPGLALALGAVFGPELVKAMGDTAADAGKRRGEELAREVADAATSFDDLRTKVREADREIEASFDEDTQRKFKNVRKYVDEAGDSLADLQEPTRKVESAIDRMASGSTDSIRNLRTNVRLNMRLIKGSLDEDSAAGKDALAKNFRAAITNVKRSIREGKISTKEGMREIRRLMTDMLALFGFSESQALNIAKGNRPDGGPEEGSRGPSPASPPRPERTTDRSGGTADRSRTIPRVSVNGPASALRSIAQGAIDTTRSAAQQRLDAIAETTGLLGGSDPGSLAEVTEFARQFGVSTGGPGQGFRKGDPGWHGKNRARDYSGSKAGMLAFAVATAATFGRRLLELIHTPLNFGIKNGRKVGLGFFGAAVNADHFDHVHVAMQHGGVVPGSGSGDKVPVQAMLEPGERFAVLNRTAARVWEAVNGLFPRLQGGGSIGIGGLVDLAQRAGFRGTAAARMAAEAMGESGGNPRARGDGGMSHGLWQIHTPSHPELARRFNLFDPWGNARAARQVYLKSGRSFSPWHADHRPHMAAALRALRSGGGGVPVGRGDGRSGRGGTIVDAPRDGDRVEPTDFGQPLPDVPVGRPGAAPKDPMKGFTPAGRAKGSRPVVGETQPADAADLPSATDHIDRDIAMAQLTPGTGDDLAAFQAAKRYWEGQLAAALLTPDPRDDTAAAQGLKQVIDAIASLQGAIEDNTAQERDLWKQAAEEARRETRVIRSNSQTIIEGLIDVVSGGIGGRIGLGFQTPSSLAAYGGV